MRNATAGRPTFRWVHSTLALLMLGAVPAVLAQSPDPPKSADHPGYRDLVALPSGTYGVEVRASGTQARVEARVGENTSRADSFKSVETVPAPRQRLTVQWSAREVRVSLGGQSMRYPAAWQIGDAIRISARGGVRVNVATAGGRRVDKNVAGSPTREIASDLIVSGSYLAKSWTLESTIDWPDEPSADDAVIVTTGHQDPTSPTSTRQSPNTFSGGVEDSSLFVLPQGQQLTRIGRGTPRTWTGNVSKSWNDPGNWNPAGVPQAGDVLTFASGPNQTTLNNNLSPSPPLGGVIVTNGNYQIQGSGLSLADGSQSTISKDFKVDTLSGGGLVTLVNQTSFIVGSQGQSTPVTPTTFSGTITGSNATFEKDGPGAFTFTGDASGVEETRVTQGNFDLVGGSLSTVFVTGPNETFAMSNNAHVGFLNVRNNGEIGDPQAGVAMTGDIQMEDMSYVQTISASGGMKLVATGTIKLSFNGNSVLTIVSGGYTPPPGSVIIMVQNDGTDAVDGVFRAANGTQLPEGSLVTVGSALFRLSYRCNAEAVPSRCDDPGNGNDIGLVSTQPVIPPPDLTITKTHTGNFTQGQTGATYTIAVTNSGSGPATGVVTVTDSLPSGLTPTTLSGTGWGCTLSTLTCTRGDALAANASFPPLTLTVTVASNAPASVTNTATVSGGGETRTDNNTATDVATVGAGADLTIDKAHTGSFTRGQTGTYTITVRNAGAGITAGSITVIDTLPTGLTATAFAGIGWTCATLPTLSCTRNEAIAAGASAPPLTLTVNVATNAPATVTNTAAVSGGGDVNLANNSDADPTIIGGEPDLTIEKTHTGNFTRGQTGTYAITVRNAGAVATSGAITVTDTLPTGLTATAFAGTGWSCTLSPLSCTRSDSIGAGASASPLTLTVTVAATAPASVSNTATVSGGGESNTTNNSATDVATIVGGPDLTIAKAHTGNFAQGQTGATYTITVTNSGTAPTNGAITVSDALPNGLTATAFAGTGWACTLSPLSCTRNEAIAAGASAPPLTLTVNISVNAPANVINVATVSGGGETTTTNNTAMDPTTIGSGPDLTITKTHTGNFTQGQTGAIYTIVVTNAGGATTTAGVSVADVLPNSLTATAFAGQGWTCDLAPALICRRDPLGAGADRARAHVDRECRSRCTRNRHQHREGCGRQRDQRREQHGP